MQCSKRQCLKFHAPAFFEQFYNRQVLRACTLALAALDAVGGLSSAHHSHNVLALATVPDLVMILVILNCKDLWNRYILRAAIGAVMTGSTFD